jgi:hypothetical protein
MSLKFYGPATSVTWLELLRKQTNTGTSTALDCRNTLIYAHTSSRTLPTCDVSLRSLTLPAPEAGDLVEIILLHTFSIFWRDGRNSWITSRLWVFGLDSKGELCKFKFIELQLFEPHYLLQNPIVLWYVIIFRSHLNRNATSDIWSHIFKKLKQQLLTYYGNNNCHLGNDVISSQQEVVLQAGKHSVAKYVAELNIVHCQQFPCTVGNIFF